jgi:hypothetical protein
VQAKVEDSGAKDLFGSDKKDSTDELLNDLCSCGAGLTEMDVKEQLQAEVHLETATSVDQEDDFSEVGVELDNCKNWGPGL